MVSLDLEVSVVNARRSWLAVLTLGLVVGGGVLALREARPAAQAAGGLVVYGDMTLFAGMGKPDNCVLKSRYKRGEPVGFRMTAIDPATGKYEPTAEITVHLKYGGKTVDLPMSYHGSEKQPQLTFWVAKWIVPADAPTGIVRYSVTAKDKKGRTGEYTPFKVDLSELTIAE